MTMDIAPPTGAAACPHPSPICSSRWPWRPAWPMQTCRRLAGNLVLVVNTTGDLSHRAALRAVDCCRGPATADVARIRCWAHLTGPG